jgi:hypothetical protein
MAFLSKFHFGGSASSNVSSDDAESSSTKDVEYGPSAIGAQGGDKPDHSSVPVRAHTDAVDDDRVAFLDTFTPQEEKRIMRKIDYRILVTIGVIYLVKQVCRIRPPSIIRY